MEIQCLKITEEERNLLSSFIGEDYVELEIDFNRLMPVVEKIETLGSNVIMGRTLYSRFEVTHNHVKLNWSKDTNYQLYLEVIPYWMDGRKNTMGMSKEYLRIEIQQETTKIESYWLAVVEFIKWYNQNKYV